MSDLDRDKAKHEALHQLAYRFWEERGYPEGSPEVDWQRAEEHMPRGDDRIAVAWSDGEMQVVVAGITEGAFPELAPEVVAAIRATAPPSGGATWIVRLDFRAGERLKAWCDARREQAKEQEPDDSWTRIVARVNEAVQPFAPAKEPE